MPHHTQQSEPPDTQQLADQVAQERDADIILYNGPIQRHIDRDLILACGHRRRRPNLLLILVTMGGDADAAYRIARCFQDNYSRFTLYVAGYCKSAGTLVALGAHELIISDHGELGPLDVQMFTKDELWETQSGLTLMDTLTALQDNAFSAFENFFLRTKARSGGSISLRTAAGIATEMTAGLFSPLYGQLNPLHIGEAGRAMSIAGHYGQRLLTNGRNSSREALDVIMSEYPSHGFVIDRAEAQQLFRQVAEPTPLEKALAQSLGTSAIWPVDAAADSQLPFRFLSSELPAETTEQTNVPPPGATHEPAQDARAAEPNQAAEAESSESAEGDRRENTVEESRAARLRGLPISSTG